MNLNPEKSLNEFSVLLRFEEGDDVAGGEALAFEKEGGGVYFAGESH